MEGIDQIEHSFEEEETVYVAPDGEVASGIFVLGEQRRVHQLILAGLDDVEQYVLTMDEETTEVKNGVRLIKHSTALVGARLGNCAPTNAVECLIKCTPFFTSN